MKKKYFLTTLSLLFCFAMQAQTFQTWRNDSGTGDNSWQNTVNWWNFPDASPIVFGQQEWDNNHLSAQVNSADLSTWRFLYKAGATDAHTFSGNQISFFDFSAQDPQIINQSTGTHTINNNINGDPDAADPLTFVIDNTGGLILGGTINNQGWIDVNGATGTATSVIFNGIISGTGGITKENTNITLNLNADNTYSGATNVNNGALVLEGSLANSAVSVGANGTLQISENATLSSLTVAAGGIVIVDAGTSLNITNNLVNNGTSFNLNSGASMIVGGTSTGNVTYNRTLTFVSGNTNGWHLVSSPVAGEVFDVDFATGGSNAIASGSGTNFGVASYNTTGNTWTYLQSPSGSISSTSGMGYSMKRASTGIVSFTGGINTGDVDDVSVGTADGGFNLLGNPYTAYMSSETFLNANTNTTGQIWTWTHGGGYTARAAVQNFIVAPGQGFFVSVASGTTVNFAETNQSDGTDNFQKNDKTEISLSIANGKLNRSARLLYFDENVTKGFDWGYEGKTFTAIKSEMEVYTHILENNIGESYQVQSLPKNEMESMVIPVGITAESGEIKFSAEAMNLPDGLKVFLEDRANNTFTRLDEANSSYAVTLSEKTDGIGRFYLHTKSSALSTDTIELNNVSMYTTNSATLRIVGLSQGKASLKLFNILGKQVLDASFNSTGVYNVNLPTLATGVYIAQLENENGKISKKIVLE